MSSFGGEKSFLSHETFSREKSGEESGGKVTGETGRLVVDRSTNGCCCGCFPFLFHIPAFILFWQENPEEVEWINVLPRRENLHQTHKHIRKHTPHKRTQLWVNISQNHACKFNPKG